MPGILSILLWWRYLQSRHSLGVNLCEPNDDTTKYSEQCSARGEAVVAGVQLVEAAKLLQRRQPSAGTRGGAWPISKLAPLAASGFRFPASGSRRAPGARGRCGGGVPVELLTDAARRAWLKTCRAQSFRVRYNGGTCKQNTRRAGVKESAPRLAALRSAKPDWKRSNKQPKHNNTQPHSAGPFHLKYLNAGLSNTVA